MNKMSKKEVFREGTFFHNITYKVYQGKVSFAKVFWLGLLGKVITGIIALNVHNIVMVGIEFSYLIAWMQGMWYSRKNVFHPLWFYVGFSTPIVFTVLTFLGSF